MFRSIASLVLLAACAATPQAAQADGFPSRAVKIIVPQTPGGASDALARIIGQKLGEKWKQPVVIENRPGAGGNLGMEAVIAAPADGYTLLMSYVGTQAINGALYKKLPFDPGSDFVPVATLATLPFVVVGKADTPYRTVARLAEAAKAGNGRSITYGSAGNGSVNHLLGEMFNAAANTRLVHVPYRGAAPALQDLMGGQIDVVFTSLPSVAGAIKSGTLFPIAVTSRQRAASFAGIPTIAEAGFGDFDVNPWFGLMGPKRLPLDIVHKINQDINELLRTKEVIDSFAAQGADVLATTPEAFGAMLKADLVKWGGVVKASGASVD